jgi:hypothetical protein
MFYNRRKLEMIEGFQMGTMEILNAAPTVSALRKEERSTRVCENVISPRFSGRERFFALFGAIHDDTFDVPDDISFECAGQREPL